MTEWFCSDGRRAHNGMTVREMLLVDSSVRRAHTHNASILSDLGSLDESRSRAKGNKITCA